MQNFYIFGPAKVTLLSLLIENMSRIHEWWSPYSLPMRQSDNAKPTLWRPAEILFLVVFFKNIKSINKLAHTNSILIKWCLNLCFRSKYEEDVLINNHTSVWGSYWKDGQWGYKCCHSFIKVLHIYNYMKLKFLFLISI